jgi:type II secretory pathway pseudopilin PulG
MKKIYKNSGESLIEVVVATVIVSMVIIAGASFFTRALDLNINIKNRVIASGLAQEGLEMVRHTRDTNWLKYSGNRREKWLCIDTPTNLDVCQGSGTSPVVLSLDTPATFSFIEDGGRHFLLATNQAADFRLYENVGVDGLSHNNPTGAVASLFSRKITLELEQEGNCDTATSSVADCEDVLNVISEVYWRDAEGGQSVTLQTKLYDFWERSKY